MINLDHYKPLIDNSYAAGTTGGYGGAVAKCFTGDEVNKVLKEKGSAPLTIAIAADINGANTAAKVIDLKGVQDVTIMGDGLDVDATQVGIRMSGCENIILFNNCIAKVDLGPKDAIGAEKASKRLVLLHNDLSGDTTKHKNYYDGLFDTKDGTQDFLVAYNRFTNHHKALLNGKSDADIGPVRGTFTRNYFACLSSRVPSVRGGEADICDNVFEDITESCINSRVDAILRIRGNEFHRVKDPYGSHYSKVVGYCDVDDDNRYYDCEWTKEVAKETGALVLRYDLPRLVRGTVYEHVTRYAGLLPPGTVVPVLGPVVIEPPPPVVDESTEPDMSDVEQHGNAFRVAIDSMPPSNEQLIAIVLADAAMDYVERALGK